MKIHPVKSVSGGGKKLRRLPHVFSKMIELPFGADADVYIEEDSSVLRFISAADGVDGGCEAQAVVVHPGVTKVVVIHDGFEKDELEFDRWRIRLPDKTLPWLATAECVDGELIVTVPKSGGMEENEVV